MTFKTTKLISTHIQTPIGGMIAISDECALHLLQFADNPSYPEKVKRLLKIMTANVEPGMTNILTSISRELELYFSGKLRTFTTPISCQNGAPFSQRVWHELCKIPYQETRSYAEIASSIWQPTAYRAVARANAVNPLAIIVPCHRVIARDGSLSGYNGGVERKAWLLEHERAVHTRQSDSYLEKATRFNQKHVF